MSNIVNLDDYYDVHQAAERLRAISGKNISIDYVRTLARYGKIRKRKIGPNSVFYLKEDVDNYLIEDRGVKSARAKRLKALNKTTK